MGLFKSFKNFNHALRKSNSDGFTHIAFVIAFLMAATFMTYTYSSMGAQIANVLFKDLKSSKSTRLAYNVGVKVAPTTLPTQCTDGTHIPTPSSWTCGNDGLYTYSCSCTLAQSVDVVGNTISAPGGKLSMTVAAVSGSQTVSVADLIWDPTVYSQFPTHGVNWNDYIAYTNLTMAAWNQPELACDPTWTEPDKAPYTVTGANAGLAATFTNQLATTWGTASVQHYNRCIHAGEFRSFLFDRKVVKDCPADGTITDIAASPGVNNVFSWACTQKAADGTDLVDATNRQMTRIYSKGLNPNFGLRDLISATVDKTAGTCTANFTKRQISIPISGGTPVTTSLAYWWRNPVVCLNNPAYQNEASAPKDLGNTYTVPTGADVVGTIYVLAASQATNGYRITGDKIGFTTLRASNVTYSTGTAPSNDPVLRLGKDLYFNFGNAYNATSPGNSMSSPTWTQDYTGTAVLSGGDIAFGADNNTPTLAQQNRRHFLWVEGNFLGDGTATNINQTSETVIFPLVFQSKFENITAINGSHVCVEIGAISDRPASGNIVANVRTEGCGSGFQHFGSYSLLHDITVANGANHLSQEDGAMFFGGNNNIAFNLTSVNNKGAGDGITLEEWNSRFYNILSAYNGAAGIRIDNNTNASQGNIIARATLAYNSGDGMFLESSSGNTAYQILAYGNGQNGVELKGAQNDFLGQIASTQNTYRGIYESEEPPPVGLQAHDNVFAANLFVASSTGDECMYTRQPNSTTVITINSTNGNLNQGGLKSSGKVGGYKCTGPDYTPPYSTNSPLRITHVGNSSASFKGAVTTDGTNPASAGTGVAAYTSIGPYSVYGNNPQPQSAYIDDSSTWDQKASNQMANWFNFDLLAGTTSFLRSWGTPAGMGYTGPCNLGNCQIWDFSLAYSISNPLLKTAVTGDSQSPAPGSGSCPSYLSGSVWTSDGSHTFLTNAVERVELGTGNMNGLCEAGEDCLYTPNFGAYQGHGTLSSCSFVGPNVPPGVTMTNAATPPRPTTIYYYSQNGQL